MLAKMRPDRKCTRKRLAGGASGGAYSAPPEPLAATNGSYFKGEGREKRDRDGEGIGREGRTGEGKG